MHDWQSPDTATAVAAAIAAADAADCAARAIACDDTTLRIGGSVFSRKDVSRVHLVAAGKAAERMASGAHSALERKIPVSGTILTLQHGSDGYRLGPFRLERVRPLKWNLPTAHAALATRRVLEEVAALDDDAVLLVLLTGGASAMLCAPRAPVTLEDCVATTRTMNAAGAPIDLLNAVRRRIDDAKGGGLAAAASGAHAAVGLLLSDVDGDDPAIIGSGPLVPLRPWVSG